MGGKLEECWKNLPFLQNRCQPGMNGVKAFTNAQKVEVLVHSNAAMKVFNLSLIYEQAGTLMKLVTDGGEYRGQS